MAVLQSALVAFLAIGAIAAPLDQHQDAHLNDPSGQLRSGSGRGRVRPGGGRGPCRGGHGSFTIQPVGPSSSTSLFVPGTFSVAPVGASSSTTVFIPTQTPQPIEPQPTESVVSTGLGGASVDPVGASSTDVIESTQQLSSVLSTEVSASSEATSMTSFTTNVLTSTLITTEAISSDGGVVVGSTVISTEIPVTTTEAVESSTSASIESVASAVTTEAVTLSDGVISTTVVSSTVPVTSASAAVTTSEPTVTSAASTGLITTDITTTIILSGRIPTTSVITDATLATSASTASAVPTANSQVKRGLAYNDATLAGPFLNSGKVGWAYNWYVSSAGLNTTLEYIPMLWGTTGDVNAVQRTVNARPAGVPRFVLSYNEPDETSSNGGSSILPAEAAANWTSQMLPIAQNTGAVLGSPAVTSFNTTTDGPLGASGLSWLAKFLDELPGGAASSQIGFVALHWYGNSQQDGASQAADFQNYVQAASAYVNQLFGKEMPLWITEFSSLPIGDQQVSTDFLDQALPFLDSYGPVARYAFFMDSAGNLVTDSKNLTQSGVRYNS